MAKFAALGTTLTKGTELIANVSNISGPTISLGIENNTTHDDTWATKVGTVPDGGEITLELEFDPTHASHTALLTDLAAKTVDDYTLEFPDATTWTLPAIVSAFSPSAPVAGKLTASVTFTISGTPTF